MLKPQYNVGDKVITTKGRPGVVTGVFKGIEIAEDYAEYEIQEPVENDYGKKLWLFSSTEAVVTLEEGVNFDFKHTYLVDFEESAHVLNAASLRLFNKPYIVATLFIDGKKRSVLCDEHNKQTPFNLTAKIVTP